MATATNDGGGPAEEFEGTPHPCFVERTDPVDGTLRVFASDV
ncbi:hypothetical protein [Haloarcula laminariae]|nr:hypothetical protein [Halomicroarcula sp. FL173]